MTETKTTPKSGKPKSQIKDVNCQMMARKKSVLIKWHGETYVTNRVFIEDLIKGKLKTQKGKKAKSVRLGVFTDDGIEDTELFLTLKGKCIYFVPDENNVLMTAVSSVEKILYEDWDEIKLGKIN